MFKESNKLRKMKKILKTLIIVSIALSQSFTNYANNKKPVELAVITGKINIPKTEYTTEITEVILKNVVDGKTETFTTTKLNSNGEFGFSVPITNPGFYYIDYGQMLRSKRPLIRLYLEPKLELNLDINEKGYILSGSNLGHNELVKQANAISDKFAFYSCSAEISNNTYEQFFPFLENEGVPIANNFIKTINTKDVAFNNLLKLAVQTDIKEHSFCFFRMPKDKFPETNNRPSIINEWEKNMIFSDLNLLKLGNGFDLMDNYFFYQQWQSKFKNGASYLSSCIPQITQPELIDVFFRESLMRNTEALSNEIIMNPLYPYLTSAKSKAFIKNILKDKGQKGLQFTCKDINDKPVSFSDFEGKYVYIDIWATWCAPCKAEIPHLKALEEELSGSDIVFMSISLDKKADLQKWKNFVKKEALGGVQLIAENDFNSDLANTYKINSIPRFLLFDKSGNIINTQADRPSNPELKKQLNELLESKVN